MNTVSKEVASELRAWLSRLEDESPNYTGMQLFTKVRTYLQGSGYLAAPADRPSSTGGEIPAACYRVDWSSKEPAGALLMAAMKAEIADLRAALATPVAAIPAATGDMRPDLLDAMGLDENLQPVAAIPEAGQSVLDPVDRSRLNWLENQIDFGPVEFTLDLSPKNMTAVFLTFGADDGSRIKCGPARNLRQAIDLAKNGESLATMSAGAIAVQAGTAQGETK